MRCRRGKQEGNGSRVQNVLLGKQPQLDHLEPLCAEVHSSTGPRGALIIFAALFSLPARTVNDGAGIDETLDNAI